MIYYDEDLVQLTGKGMAIEWVARTVIETLPDGKQSLVAITQDGETIYIPWCYLLDIIEALEIAQDELERHRCS
nr:MAG: hypothetical protein [Bacteriophage sp.]